MRPVACLRPVLVPVLLGGCFSYVQLATGTPGRGTEVVATVRTPLEVRLGDVTVHDVILAQGRVAYADPDSIVLSGTRFLSESGVEYGSLGTSVRIERSTVTELKRRHVSAWKTALAVGASGAVLAAILASVGPLAGSSSGGGPPKPGASLAPPPPPPQP